MAIVCDYCPHEVDGKFSLANAELATVAICFSNAPHPTIDKSACDDHFETMVTDSLVGKMPGAWISIRLLKVEA